MTTIEHPADEQTETVGTAAAAEAVDAAEGRSNGWQPDGLHPLRVQLRHRGAPRRRGRPPLRAHPRRQGPPGLAGLHLREGAAARPLPERPRPAHEPAAPAGRRHVRGDRLGHRHRRGGGAVRDGARRRTAASRSSTTAAAARGTTSAAPTAAATLRALGARYRSNALAQEKTGEFWVNGQDARRHGPRRLRARRGRALRRQEPVAVATASRTPGTTLKEIAHDPERSLIVIDPRRTETAELADIHLAGAARHRRLVLAALVAVLVQEDLVDRRVARRARRRARRGRGGVRRASTSPTTPRSAAWPRSSCAPRPGASPRRRAWPSSRTSASR